MWPDIDDVPLWQRLPESVKRLPRTNERFAASLFFLQEAGNHVKTLADTANWRSQGMPWLASAAIVAHCGVEESLSLDLEDLGHPDNWKRSPERKAIFAEPLMLVVHELRNYAVHFEFHRAALAPFVANVSGEDHDLGPAAFFVPIKWTELSRLRNLRKKGAALTADMVDWFNHQASAWPGLSLIAKANQQYADQIGAFMTREGL